MSKTIQATVKVMISYNYCHFEFSKTIEPSGTDQDHLELTQKEIDDARKDCQRLADKAVGQYQKSKNEASKMASIDAERQQLRREVAQIKVKPEEEWSIYDKAKVKALADYDHEAFYNYMDDEGYHI